MNHNKPETLKDNFDPAQELGVMYTVNRANAYVKRLEPRFENIQSMFRSYNVIFGEPRVEQNGGRTSTVGHGQKAVSD